MPENDQYFPNESSFKSGGLFYHQPIQKITPVRRSVNKKKFDRLIIAAEKENKLYAEKLHKNRISYALYGAIDGVNSLYSAIKFAFDIRYIDKALSSDALHEWITKPEGLAAMITLSVGTCILSTAANYFKDDDVNAFKRYLAYFWPFFRDVFKSLRDSFKIARSLSQLSDSFKIIHTTFKLSSTHLIVPISLPLGLVSIAIRFWSRDMIEKRKTMMITCGDLIKKIREKSTLSKAEHFNYHIDVDKNKQTKMTIRLAYASAICLSISDSLYLYLGILFTLSVTSLASFGLPVLGLLITYCVLFACCNIVTGIYTEYNYQRQLEIKGQEVLFEIEKKLLMIRIAELETIITAGNTLQSKPAADLVKKIFLSVNLVSKKRQHLQSLSKLNGLQLFLVGIKNGLAAYSAFISIIMSPLAAILILSSTAFPPALLIACVVIGIALLIGFLIHACRCHYNYLNLQKEKNEHFDQSCRVLKAALTTQANADFKHMATKFTEGELRVYHAEQSNTEKIAEIIRNFGAGFNKGNKAFGLEFNSLQNPDEKGHFQDSTPMVIAGFVVSILSGIAMTFRAYARSYGRLPPGYDDSAAADPVEDQEIIEQSLKPAEQIPRSQDNKPTAINDSPPVNPSSANRLNSLYRFFCPLNASTQEPNVSSQPLSY